MPRTLLWCLFLNRKNGAQKSQVTCPRSLSLVSSWAGIQTPLMHLITKLHCFPLVKGNSTLKYRTQNYKTAIWGQVPWVCIHFLTEYSQNPCERNTTTLVILQMRKQRPWENVLLVVPQGQVVGKALKPRSSETVALPVPSVQPILPFAGGGPGATRPGQGWRTERTEGALTCSSLWGHLVFKDDSEIPNLSQFQEPQGQLPSAPRIRRALSPWPDLWF